MRGVSMHEHDALECLRLQGPDPVQELPGTQPGHFDVCIANILQGPLLDLYPRLAGYVKPGGHLLLSGILTSQVIYQARQCCLYASSCLAALPEQKSSGQWPQ